jgi:predicted GNAT family N-acyltransferase
LSADCRLTVTVRSTEDADEIDAAHALRREVFLGEQKVDAKDEFDEHEATATQVVALDEKGVVATCRLREYGEAGRDLKLERMAVVRELRGSGVGSALLAGAEDLGRERGLDRMVLHAQTRAQGFYAANGYVAEGDLFMEAGIEHVRMTKPLNPAAA